MDLRNKNNLRMANSGDEVMGCFVGLSKKVEAYC